jgi:hypothetical protein
MITQGPCACTPGISGRIAAYFKYSIRQPQYMKRTALLFMLTILQLITSYNLSSPSAKTQNHNRFVTSDSNNQ